MSPGRTLENNNYESCGSRTHRPWWLYSTLLGHVAISKPVGSKQYVTNRVPSKNGFGGGDTQGVQMKAPLCVAKKESTMIVCVF